MDKILIDEGLNIALDLINSRINELKNEVKDDSSFPSFNLVLILELTELANKIKYEKTYGGL